MIEAEKLGPLLELFKKHGVVHIKMAGLELTLAQEAPAPIVVETPAYPAAVDEKEEIPHKNEELTDVMKLSDTDLVDRLWPEAKPEDEKLQ